MKLSRKQSIQRRHRRVRKKVNGSADRPRLAIFRSQQHIYAQLIDDTEQQTIAAASSLEPEMRAKLRSGANKDAATQVGKLVAQRAIAKGIQKVVFDRGGNLYHGRIQALADAAREAGLEF
jgi:large subunit ribosomal protein L18